MENEEEEDSFPTRYTDIPKEFYSEATGKPFEECSVCGKHLLHDDEWYLVEKAVKRYPEYGHKDVVFEYAICVACSEQMREKLSTESKQRIEAFFAERLNPTLRMIGKYAEGNFNLNDWISTCAITGKPIDTLSEYQIMAPFNGRHMAFTTYPMMLSAEAMDEILPLLSNHSLDVLNGFKDDITGMPPDLRELFKETSFMVV